MKITSKAFFISLVFIFILNNAFLLLNVNPWFITTILSFINFLIIPGLLLLMILRALRQSLGEAIIYSVGLSVFILELVGLVINYLLPIFHIQHPLSLIPALFGYNIIYIIFFVVAWSGNKNFSITFKIPKTNLLNLVFLLVPPLLPILATLGAISINNGGSNLLTLVLLGMVAGLILLATLFRYRISTKFFPYTIFFIALSLLLMTSLRSWYVSGHDVQRELYVYSITKKAQFWDVGVYRDAYNACLSITILPTVLEKLLLIPGIYIFKIVFQIIFSLSPVLIYYVLKKYTSEIKAFLSVFAFMAFPTFFNDMPMLTRQEIGFLFFSLGLHILLTSKFSNTIRKVLFIIFTIAVILSHYSTNYILLALVLCVYIFSHINSHSLIKRVSHKLKIANDQLVNAPFLSIGLISAMVVSTYLWTFQITKTNSNLSKTFQEVTQSLINKPTSDNRSNDVGYSIFFSKKLDPQAQLDEYIKENVAQARSRNEGNFYSNKDFENYKTISQEQERLPVTTFGENLSSIGIPVFKTQAILRQLAAISMQLLVVVGILIIIFKKHRKPIDIQFLYLCIGGLILLALTIILPSISVEYGLLRMFQQMLFVFSLPIVLAIYSLLFFAKKNIRYFFTSSILVVMFLTLTGFLSHLTGGYYPQLNLDNKGLYYSAYYIHKADVLSAQWLSDNIRGRDPVQSDLSGTSKLQTYGNIFALSEIFPQIIRKNSYVYYTGNLNTIVSFDKNILIYSSSEKFTNSQKNLIYSNGKDNIYR